MRDLHWYAVQKHILTDAMKAVVIESTTLDGQGKLDYVTYHRYRNKALTIPIPPQEELHMYLYGSMIMEGYTMVLSPDALVHLCGGGTAVYSVTPTSCTCAASTYSNTPCKHMRMLKGYETHRLKAMALRARALHLP